MGVSDNDQQQIKTRFSLSDMEIYLELLCNVFFWILDWFRSIQNVGMENSKKKMKMDMIQVMWNDKLTLSYYSLIIAG